MEDTKLCPFRRDKGGEFSPCYGEKCMAYYEYEQPVYPVTTTMTVAPPPVKRCGCSHLPVPSFYGGSCV